MPLPSGKGIRLAASLRKTHPALGVIVLSTYSDAGYALKLFESGCDSRGYLLKDRIRDRQRVLEVAVTVAGGGSVIDATIVEELVSSRIDTRRSPLELLTPRELEAALAATARRSAIPVTIHASGMTRAPGEIASAAYFCCLEALQNAAKHAGPDARAVIERAWRMDL